MCPEACPGAGSLKVVALETGAFYNVNYTKIHGRPFSNLTAAQHTVDLSVQLYALAYAPYGSRQLPAASLMVSEYDGDTISAFMVDSSGNPVPDSRQPFLYQERVAGLAFDPVTGDLLFSNFDSRRIGVVSGFSQP